MLLRATILAALTFLIACQSAPKVSPIEANAITATQNEKIRSHVFNHQYFEIHYAPDFKLAKFVKYTLTAENLRQRTAQRRDRFFSDPHLKNLNLPAIFANAYRKSGYHRGHMAPAEDFRYNQDAIDATFVMTNMAPQKPSLNSGAWKRLEQLMRRYACGEERVTILTGPILNEGLPRLRSGVSIPSQFFKVVIDETPPTKVKAYLFNQDDRGRILEERTVSLGQLKEKLREDFVSAYIPPAPPESDRQPAQENPWKEADCN